MSDWERLRESVGKMSAGPVTNDFSQGVQFAFSIVLSEMITIEHSPETEYCGCDHTHAAGKLCYVCDLPARPLTSEGAPADAA